MKAVATQLTKVKCRFEVEKWVNFLLYFRAPSARAFSKRSCQEQCFARKIKYGLVQADSGMVSDFSTFQSVPFWVTQ